jgi:translation initiation factor 3 subunit L
MMRRYVDSIKAFSTILMFINRSKQYLSRLYQADQISKKTEHMHTLLAIAISLCPQRIEENIHSAIRDKLNKLQRGDEAFLKEFSMACPKSISASPIYAHDDSSPAQNSETLHRLWCFLGGSFQEQFRQQQQYIPTLRSYLKLYTTIKISKLSQIMEIDEETLRTQLICFKHKTRNIAWNGGPLLSGTWSSSSEIDFYIDQDMIHIVSNRVSRRNSEFFIKYIIKFEEILSELEAPIDAVH